MAESRTTRNVVVAGGALAVFLLLFRGSGWGLGGSGGASHSGGGGGWFGFDDAALHPLFVIHVRPTSPRGDHYFAGATVADAVTRPGVTLLAVVDEAKRAAASGARVVVHASGAARQGDYDALMQKLRDAGVSFSVLETVAAR